MNRILSVTVLLWRHLMPLRFIIIGGWNTVFSYLVFCGLYYQFGGGWGDLVVQAMTSVIGITNAYVLHRLFTFCSHGVWWREYFRFYVVYGGQVVLQSGCFFLFSTWLYWNGYVVQFVFTAVFTALSYWAHKRYSFKLDGI